MVMTVVEEKEIVISEVSDYSKKIPSVLLLEKESRYYKNFLTSKLSYENRLKMTLQGYQA